MQFIPTYCDTCERLELTAAASITNGEARCSECHATSRSRPGQSYAEDDVALFNDLRGALQEAGITQQNATSLVNQLEYGGEHRERGLRRLAHLVPALGMLELIVDNHPGTLRKAEGMLAILLETLALGRRQSVIVPTYSSSDEANGESRKNLG
jgi:hypothetical protein